MSDAAARRRHYVICNWRDSAHPQAGGAELYCEEVARHLAAGGARMTLLTSRPAGAAARDDADFGAVVRVGGKFGTYLRGLVWLARNRGRIDGVIDSENGIPYFAPLALRRRTPLVLLMHHVHQAQFGLYFPPGAARIGRLLEKWGVRLVYGRRAVAAVSPSTRIEIRRQLGLRGPVYLAPNGLSPAGPEHTSARAATPTIVCVGRVVPHKRYELLVDAMQELLRRWPDLQVHLAGDGEARASIERRSAALGLGDRLVVHGRLSHADRDRLLTSAWLTVNPTVGEGWGLSVLEAAALGVPAVAFDVPGMQDSVRPGHTGWLAADGEQLADAVDRALRTLSDPAEAEAWAQRCRDWAESFRWEVTAERLRAVLEVERDRLAAGAPERRSNSDVSTVAEVPRSAVTEGALRRLRRTDQVRLLPDAVQLLLGGADEHDARRALQRIGIADQAGIRTWIARRGDLFGWSSPEAAGGDLGPRPIMERVAPGQDHAAAGR